MALQPYTVALPADEPVYLGELTTIGAVIVCTNSNQPLPINPKHFQDADDAEEFLQLLLRQNVDARDLQPENLRDVAFEWSQLRICATCDRRVPPDAFDERREHCRHCWDENEDDRQGELAAEIAMERGV